MFTNPVTQNTQFSRDVMGRYVCNGLDEAMNSADTNLRADARPFDVIIIGGGSFGASLAQHLYSQDKQRAHRVLVLEGGPFVLPEHVQNMPMIGLATADPTSIAELQNKSAQDQQRWSKEVWGLAWHSQTPFPGLAYCLGGRSLFWGGWSPQLLDGEMHTVANGVMENLWPAEVVADFHTLPNGEGYFRQAGKQLGTSEANDFIQGPMHDALRQMLFDGITQNKVSHSIPLSEIPLNVDVPLRVAPADMAIWKLEAPLAVQSRTRAGFFPMNKFSSIPLLIKAEREAQQESGNDDVKKRLMVVPNCHVKRLRTGNGRVTMVETNLGDLPLAANTKVIIAMGTIESTRLALNSFQELPNYALIGQNLMAHLRSNLTIRIPRTALQGLDPALKELQASALFVKGRLKHADNTEGYFHLQITASGLGAMSTPDSEAELFRKVPDIDGFDVFHAADDQNVVITIRGIGQMEARNPANAIKLDPNLDRDEYGIPRAFVQLTDPQTPGVAQANPASAKDLALWAAMDKAADDVAKIFAAGGSMEVIAKKRDKLGTTHHETGTLWMGDNPKQSVTAASGQFHHLDNAYAVGPAVFPTIGSPNPMLTGMAMARRLADRLLAPPAYVPETGFQALFDGSNRAAWQMAGPGNFIVVDGAIETVTGGDIGLCWCSTPTPANFILKLEWRCSNSNDNSGVFIRFPNPLSKGYSNPAYVGVHFGFEVQIDEQGIPDGQGLHKTGAIYNEATQTLTPVMSKPIGEWNEYEIQAKGQTYTVKLNGKQITTLQNQDPGRGLPSTNALPSFIGLQSHTGNVAFRKIRIKAI